MSYNGVLSLILIQKDSMQASSLVRTPLQLLIGTAVLALAACGGGSSVGGVSGSSSGGGGGSSVLAGTFTNQTGTSQRIIGSSINNVEISDTVFGAVDGQGNGFLADMSAAGAGNQAVFRLSPASQPNAGTISGDYDAYFTGGTNNQIILGGALTGTYTATSANLTFGPISGGTSSGATDTAALVLDNPAALPQVSSATIAGTYTATVGTIGSTGSLAISTSSNQADIYTVTVSGGNITIGDSSTCNFTGTVTPVSTFDVYDVSTTGTCPSTTGGNANNISLTGLAVYLPKGAKSPLGGTQGALAQPALLLELDNSEANTGTSYAFALVAVQ